MQRATKWQLFEYVVTVDHMEDNPFWDVSVRVDFDHDESGEHQTIAAFYDGNDPEGRFVWKVRWTPDRIGVWTGHVHSTPRLEQLEASFSVTAEPASGGKGFLRADPTLSYGFRFDDGEQFFLFGDTMYNLFGAHFCGVNVEEILRHRQAQGVNYVRARLPVSPYHPPTPNEWQNRDSWPWGGSIQIPDFTSLNLEYFRSVDQVMEMITDLGMGVELILEAWLFEFPFNDRGRFLPEHETMWFDYAIARYSAYPSVYVWCPANEYEYYPEPKQNNPVAERWIDRLCRMIRVMDPFAHPIGVHNWGSAPSPLSHRVGHLDSFDVYLFQTRWRREFGEFQRDASLCMWLESDIRRHIPDRDKVRVCAEFGYERVEGLFVSDALQHNDQHHTRRGQWRSGFFGVPVIHGFNNTWGAFMDADKDAAGARYLPIYYRFMTEIVDFATIFPADDLFLSRSGSDQEGTLPLCIASEDHDVISVYFPTHGECELDLDRDIGYDCHWFDPRLGETTETTLPSDDRFVTPESRTQWEDDWVLLLRRRGGA